MKKYNLYLWFIALVGLITSCSQDEAAGPQNDSNRVRIGASIEQAVQTRTASVTIPDNHCLRYVLEVWSTGDPSLIYKNEKTMTNATTVEFEFELVDKGDYKVLLWADFVADNAKATAKESPNAYTHYKDKHYTTANLKEVALTGDYTVNDESRDAFFACKPITKEEGALNESITLTRPFGQINIIEKDEELLGKVKSITLAYAVPYVFNVEDGATTGTKDVNPTVSTLPEPAGDRKANLFYDFIFAPESGQRLLEKIDMIFTSSNPTVTLNNFEIPANMPAERNKRTNISGSILHTSTVPDNTTKLSVTVDDTWTAPIEKDATPNVWDGKSTAEPTGYTDNPGKVDITSAAELAWLAWQCNIGGNKFQDYTFNLTTDIDLNNKLWTPIGNVENRFKGNFNGQGHTVRNMKVDEKGDGAIATAGFIGYMEGEDGDLLKVSNLIVEGNVNAVSTDGMDCVGGICGYASFVKFEFCRFNGTVSGTGEVSTECGGIVGEYAGNRIQSLTCCISDAKVTVNGQSGSDYGGGLVGNLVNGLVTYSAWNSKRTTVGVGKIGRGTFDEALRKPFTDITELNESLDDMNESKSESEYKWKAGDDANAASPILVKRTPSGTN